MTNTSSSHRSFVLHSLLLLISGVALVVPSAQADPQRALEATSESAQVPLEFLEIEGESSVEFPRQGLSVEEFKVADTRPDGITYGVTLDPRGRSIDGAELRATEMSLAEQEEPSKFDRRALEEWQAAGGEARWFTVWLREPRYDIPDRPEPGTELTSEEVEELGARFNRRRAQFVEWTVGPFLERLHDFVDHHVRFTYDDDALETAEEEEIVRFDRFSPAVHVKAAPDLLRELASLDEVEYVYQPENFQPMVGEARYSVGAGYLETLFGLTGKEARVAMIEFGNVGTSSWLWPI